MPTRHANVNAREARASRLWIFASAGLLTLACAACASYPPPTQPLADTQAAGRSAQELGALEDPQARLHLKLAEEQVEKAKQLMDDGDNERAEQMLMRAKADAELAISLAREQKAKVEVKKTLEKANLQNQAVNPGVVK